MHDVARARTAQWMRALLQVHLAVVSTTGVVSVATQRAYATTDARYAQVVAPYRHRHGDLFLLTNPKVTMTACVPPLR